MNICAMKLRLSEHLEKYIPDDPDEACRFGELLLSRDAKAGGYRAIHRSDQMFEAGMLSRLETVPAAREWSKYCVEGNYRPLKTAPSLRAGFVIQESDIDTFYQMIDAIYPAVFATAVRYFLGDIEPVSLRKTLDRQTGMYQFAKNITDNQANQIMRELCARGCVRKIAWPIDKSCAFSRLPEIKRNITPVCTEACTFAVSEARRLAREAYDRANAPTDD